MNGVPTLTTHPIDDKSTSEGSALFPGERFETAETGAPGRSAALRFIPKEDLEKDGYGQYENLFKN